MSNKSKTVLITGATAGIGRMTALHLAKRGHHVIATGRKSAELFAAVEQRRGVVDVLVNNAGFGDAGLFSEEDPARIDGMIALNIAALTALTRRFLPGMVERRRGRVLNVASTAAFQPGPMMAVYFATKAYVLSFSVALGEELRGTGVTVTALCPGPTATNFANVANAGDAALFAAPMMPVMKPAKVARLGYRALKDGKRFVVTGMANRFTAALGSFGPYFLTLPITRRLLSTER